MELANQGLLELYKTWIDAFSEERALFDHCVIGLDDVLNAHFSLVDYFLEKGESKKNVGPIGPVDKGLLSAAVAAQTAECSGNLKWKTGYEKCSALFYGLVKNHPFHDCNKTTALLTTLYYLSKLDLKPTAHHKELEIITRIIASNTIKERKAFKPYSKFENGEICFLATYFQKNTHPIHSRYYTMTYNELNRKLGSFGFFLSNPRGNSIDIIKIGKRTSLFGFRNDSKKHSKVGVIGFTGWTREIPENEMKLCKAYTGLSEKDGIDSQAVYEKAPPLSSLINEYGGVLQQLAKS